ncbi:MAG: MnhB domain-containing protein [Dehalococcoidia bacterium]|jgi:energy-converting hydrogenase B subunit I
MLSRIVRTVSNQLILFILIFGFYLLVHGHDSPGGGFQGGAVVASGVVMLLVAFGAGQIIKSLKVSRLTVVACCGALVFIVVALAGTGTTFFYNFLLGTPIFGEVPPPGPGHSHVWSGGIIPVMEIAIGFVVMAGLSAVALAMAKASNREEIEE